MRILQTTLLAIFMFVPVFLIADTNSEVLNEIGPEVGDVLVLNEPTGVEFQHVYFPNANVLQKRTGVIDYSRVAGMKVTVSKVEEKNGRTIVTLKPMDDKKFFRFWRSVKADYQKAVDAGELSVD